MRKKRLIRAAALFCVLALGAAALVFWLNRGGTGPGAGTVNGEPFLREDLDVYAMELRAAVAMHYGRKYNLPGMGAAFWDTKFEGRTPNEFLTELALQNLARNMVLIQEARKRGIDAPQSWGGLAAEREERNTPTGEIVYGPKQLGQAEYNSYRISGIRDELKTTLLRTELAPTEAQLRAAFDSLPEDFKHAPFRAQCALFSWDTGSAGTGAATKNRGMLEQALREGTPQAALAALRGKIPGLAMEDFSLDSAYISKEDPYQNELAALLKEAVPGDSIPGPGEKPELYYLREKEGGGIFSFEEAPGLGRNKWINNQFELFLDRKVKEAKIRLFRQ